MMGRVGAPVLSPLRTARSFDAASIRAFGCCRASNAQRTLENSQVEMVWWGQVTGIGPSRRSSARIAAGDIKFTVADGEHA